MDYSNAIWFFRFVISSGGASIGAYQFLRWVYNRLGISPLDKRIYAFICTAIFAAIASIMIMWLTSTWPTTPIDWFMKLWLDVGTAIIVGQGIHGYKELSRTKE